MPDMPDIITQAQLMGLRTYKCWDINDDDELPEWCRAERDGRYTKIDSLNGIIWLNGWEYIVETKSGGVIVVSDSGHVKP